MEQSCETHYSNVKRGYSGNPALKDFLVGTQRLHTKQMLDRRSSPTVLGVHALTLEEVQELGLFIYSYGVLVGFGLWVCHPPHLLLRGFGHLHPLLALLRGHGYF